eukprot:Hpha_TRINITY_DN15503_c5_g6::TRINITY_DN15503_c5_g6_i1::g.104650::m.104650
MRHDRPRSQRSLPPLRAALALCGFIVIAGIVIHTIRFQLQAGHQQQQQQQAQVLGDTKRTPTPLSAQLQAEATDSEGHAAEVEALRAEVRRLTEERDRLLHQSCPPDSSSGHATQQDTPNPNASGLAAWEDEPEAGVAGWRIEENLRLVHGRSGDRSRLELAGKCEEGKAKGGTTFVSRDICQLGHLPKDATHLFVYMAQGGAVDRIVFGSDCMTRDEKRQGLTGPAYSRTWHEATKHWFQAILEAWGGKPEIIHSENTKDICLARAVTRDETWRWFPGTRTAHAFRTLLTRHLGIEVPLRLYGKAPLAATVVRRLEDRNFDEEKVGVFIANKFGKVIKPNVVFFDNKDLHGRMLANVSALSYLEQMQLMAKTDIFIAAHGAAMTNVIAMHRGTAVIELFPNAFRYYMFEELIRLLGLHYFPYESPYPPSRCAGCSGRSGAPNMTDPRDFHGVKKCKRCPIKVPEVEWYYLVKSAASAVWLSQSRRQSVHLFDQRKTK